MIPFILGLPCMKIIIAEFSCCKLSFSTFKNIPFKYISIILLHDSTMFTRWPGINAKVGWVYVLFVVVITGLGTFSTSTLM